MVESLFPADTAQKKKRYKDSMKKYIAYEKIYQETIFLTRSYTIQKKDKANLSRSPTSRLGRFVEREGVNMKIDEEQFQV